MNNGIHEGKLFSWTNSTGSAVASGDIVPIAGILAVATVDIADGATGTVKVGYAVKAPKVSAAVIAQGETLTWDVSAGAFDDNAATPATGDITGAAAFAMSAAGNDDTVVEVVLTGVPGTVN
jgi:predicted RecA/RadA family phage recombinase